MDVIAYDPERTGEVQAEPAGSITGTTTTATATTLNPSDWYTTTATTYSVPEWAGINIQLPDVISYDTWHSAVESTSPITSADSGYHSVVEEVRRARVEPEDLIQMLRMLRRDDNVTTQVDITWDSEKCKWVFDCTQRNNEVQQSDQNLEMLFK